ncbi:response regulator [Aliikangiella coralliicola]|uniref:Response regulator n=1 Tax=Aliikangiella coralliicola TaxID=2592383 RepID=A0A545UCM1_9GAMM|nr:response regulator [Aliikangiella coralliicola]TQV87208.1 response regulator [Aliikangiella coralliicola]
MSQQQKILVVDDAVDNRLLLKMLLEDSYQVDEVDSGRACLDLLQNESPDLILLDINMPETSGYEVCSEIRKTPEISALPVIFVSALDSTEERLAGFEVGADDYITKPVDGEELLKKVELRLARQQEIADAKNEASMAMNVAMEAMTSSSELGQIIQFVKKVEEQNTLEAVGTAILAMAQEFSLNSCALVTGEESVYVGCQAGSLEARLLEKFLSCEERVTNLGIRTIIRSDNLVLLVKNMPLDDESRYGRLKDHLAVLTDIANGRLSTINAKIAMLSQRKDILNQVISLAEKQIKLTSEKIHLHSETVIKTMEAMLNELESMLFGLGLEEDQEKKLMVLADRTSDNLTQNNEQTSALDSELGVILEALYDLLEKE